jgi:hypothetical protein
MISVPASTTVFEFFFFFSSFSVSKCPSLLSFVVLEKWPQLCLKRCALFSEPHFSCSGAVKQNR